ncbi:MAG: MoaD/ThiS family protein [Candidatus Woesearchaeota archaeon]|jgi:sulfur carrier protein ThiS
MEVFIERVHKTKIVHFKGTVKELLKKMDINPVVVLVVRNNELLAEDDILKTKDNIRILSVVSGG